MNQRRLRCARQASFQVDGHRQKETTQKEVGSNPSSAVPQLCELSLVAYPGLRVPLFRSQDLTQITFYT